MGDIVKWLHGYKGEWLLKRAVAGVWLGIVAQAGAATAPDTDALAQPYLRATNQFAVADFFKPAEPTAVDLSFTLAPLIFQEVRGDAKRPATPERFGALTRSNGVLSVDTSRPVVYVALESLHRNGKAHAQLTYLWAYSGQPLRLTAPELQLQGVRLTLDSSGQPSLWEVLADHSGAELFFVSQKLELAAAAEWGKALPGRRFAIERSRSEAPKAVVARVLDDAPAVMGPMVYLQAQTHNTSTLLCRCMPAQVKKLLRTRTYTLLPFSAESDALLREARARSTAPPAFWPNDSAGAQRLERCLRLPGSF